ncbi:hypothetical protein [Macrococcus bovicus]|uniref:hypothetical protein n=1 Tax=Macrococcus bovicus TaxID=69968 RepID=UPI0025A67E47|nr:hypothetical protein [Macrococcus bovicus]WJP97092.1 hypothetical protein QSV55_07345 [Macrococcus bovicus]
MNNTIKQAMSNSRNFYDNNLDTALKEIETKILTVSKEGDTFIVLNPEGLGSYKYQKLLQKNEEQFLEDILDHLELPAKCLSRMHDVNGKLISLRIDWSDVDDK